MNDQHLIVVLIFIGISLASIAWRPVIRLFVRFGHWWLRVHEEARQGRKESG